MEAAFDSEAKGLRRRRKKWRKRVYYISPLMTEHMLSVYLCHVLAK